MLLLFNELETSFFGGWQPCFWQVEFRASFTSGCRRASRCFPELSITYVGFQNYPYFLFIVVNKFLLVFNVPIEQVLEQKSIIRNSWSWTFSKCCRKIWNISWWWVTDIKYEGYTISFRPSVTFFFFEFLLMHLCGGILYSQGAWDSFLHIYYLKMLQRSHAFLSLILNQNLLLP